MADTLCDSCARGADECSFMARLIPVPGWEAERIAYKAGKSLYQNAEARSIAVRFVREWQGSWGKDDKTGLFCNEAGQARMYAVKRIVLQIRPVQFL